jgi:hypothetical protein
MVVVIKNFSGFIEVDKDGNWSCPTDKKRKQEIIPNPVFIYGKLFCCIAKGMFVYIFLSLAFGRSKNWMVSKARSWKHFSMSFSASRFCDHPAFGSPES